MPLYFAYFDNWDVKKNYEFIKKKIDFKEEDSGRSPGTFTNYDSLDDHVNDLLPFQFLKFDL